MSSRDKILQKLRSVTHSSENPPLQSWADDEIFSDMPGSAPTSLKEQFAERLLALSGEFHAVADVREAAEKVFGILGAAENERFLVQNHAMLTEMLSHRAELKKCCDILDNDLAGNTFAGYMAGISVAESLVARTGSIVLRNTTAGGRRLSVLPPVHIVLAQQSQLVPSLEQALQAVDNNDTNWSYGTIITGPSRTADIQKNLVLGAHGPKRLAVVMIDDEGKRNA